MSNTIDVGEVQEKVKDYFKFDKLLMLGIHEDDGGYITILDDNVTDIEILCMIQALKDARERRVKNA